MYSEREEYKYIGKRHFYILLPSSTSFYLTKMLRLSAATALAFASGAMARTFTVYNACPFTIW